jgi:hypothetical protein
MVIKKIPDEICQDYIAMLKKHGEEGLYRRTVGAGFLRLTKIENPDLEALDYSDAFFILYRRTGEDMYFSIGRSLRRAAHTIYRELLRQNKTKKLNFKRFLNVI